MTPQIIGGYPNTYTFTKFLTEHMLLKMKGDIPLNIVRPTIIGGSYREPMEGWVDSVSAAGAFYMMFGIGLLKVAYGNLENIGD